MRDRLIKACRRQRTDTRPIWLMRQAGRYLPEYRKIRERYDVMTICRTPELAAMMSSLPVELFEVDAAVIFADIMLPLESLGVRFRLEDGVGPVVADRISSLDQVRSLSSFEPSRLSFVFDAIKETRRLLNDSVPVIGFSGGPFTLASYLIEGGPSRDFARTKGVMFGRGRVWTELMERLSEMASAYLQGQARAGAKVLQLFDSWVGSLNEAEYREYVLPYSRAVIRKASETGVPLIHFGVDTAAILECMAEAGGDVIGVDWRVNIDEAWRRVGHDRGIQGNLDPAVLLSETATIRRHAEDVLRRTAGFPGHIFNLGHGVLPNTPPENVKELVEYVHVKGAT